MTSLGARTQLGGVPAVKLRGVGYAYPGAAGPALRDVDFEVPAGQCVVVTGPSGCGKTTLTRLVNGLVPHVYEGDVEGCVEVAGRDVALWEPGELGTLVGSVFQNPRSQFVNVDTTSEIAFGCENLGLPREEMARRVDAAAAALGIKHLLGRPVEGLSGGQKQLVIIASALAMEPDVFVMDEPTASLDAEAMRLLAQAIVRLKRAGKTVIVSEHRLWWLADVADRVVRMDAGRIVGDWRAADYARIPRGERLQAGERAWTVQEMELEGASGQGGDSTVLEACSIQAGYRSNPKVLDGMDIGLHAGAVTGLLGSNGAGKTTLLRCLSGLTREKAGAVALDGEPLPFGKRPALVHLVMQEPGYQLFADSAAAELVQAQAAAASMLERFGLEGLADRHPLSLSGGERQRLAIACGMVRGARAIVLDEPTSGLDHGNMRRVVEVIRDAASRGAAVCVVTHDYEFLCHACDEVAELEGGCIAARYALDSEGLSRARSAFGFQ